MRQSGSALRKLIRSVAAAELWRGGVGKNQEQDHPRKTQSGTGAETGWDRLIIGPGDPGGDARHHGDAGDGAAADAAKPVLKL
jgi:hypothetical protein